MSTVPYTSFRHSSFSGLIGISQKDITPPVDIYSRNWGAAKHDTAIGIHRPLKLSCTTFQVSQKAEKFVLIAADLCVWRSFEDGKLLRNEIIKALSITPSHMMFCLTHTHSAPSLSRQDGSKKGGEYIDEYLKFLQQSAIEAAEQAIASAVPATLTWHYGTCNLATNRDLPEAGKKRYILGFNAAKKADNTLLVGRITDKNNRITGTIVNYACHPTTLAWDNHLLSPDYVGAMRDLVQQETNAPCLFLQGASGDLAPAEQYSGDIALADKHGRQLGYSVLACLESMLPPDTQLSFSEIKESGAALAVWKKRKYQPPLTCLAAMVDVEFILKPLPALKELEEQYRNCDNRMLKERLWRKLNIRKTVGNGDKVKIPLWVWRLGDSVLVGHPNEAYSEFQKSLRADFPQHTVCIINLANGNASYLPPSKLYNKDIYAVWHTPFAKGALEKLIKTARAQITNINKH